MVVVATRITELSAGVASRRTASESVIRQRGSAARRSGPRRARLRLRVRVVLTVIALLSAVIAHPLAAQSESVNGDRLPDPRPRRIIVIVQSVDDPAFPSGVLAESLAAALAASREGLQVRVTASSDETPQLGADRAHANAYAREHDADAYLLVNLERDAQDVLTVRWQIGDVLQNTDSTGQYRTPLKGPRELHRRTWIPIVEAIATDVPPRSEAVTLEIRGVPNTRIRIDPGTQLTLDEHGVATASLPVPGEYHLEAHHREYLNVRERVALESRTTLRLDQQRRPAVMAQASLFNAQFPEIAAAWLPRRQEWYIGAAATFFQLGVALRERDDQGNQDGVFVSLPLVHLGLIGGYRFGDEELPARPYVGLNPFLRVKTNGGLALEPNASIGIAVNAGVEYRLFASNAISFEWTPTFYPTDGRVAREEFYDGDPGTATVSLDGLFMELTLIRIGYRRRF